MLGTSVLQICDQVIFDAALELRQVSIVRIESRTGYRGLGAQEAYTGTLIAPQDRTAYSRRKADCSAFFEGLS